MKMTRTFIAILCLLLVATTFLTACREEEDPSQTQTPQVQAGTYQDLVPAKDIDRDIKILTDFAPSGDIHAYSGDPVWDAEVDMYLLAEQKYSVSIEYKTFPNERAFAVLERLRNSDAHEYDLVYNPHPNYGIYTLVTSGTLVDLHSVSTLKLSEEWYNASQVANYTANGKLYLCVPDFTIQGQGLTSYIYNGDRYTDLGFEEDLYQVVRDGKWTVDKLLTIVQEAGSNTNGGDQSYALCFWQQTAGALLYSMGQDILVKNSSDEYELGLDANRMTTIVEKTKLLVKQEGVLVNSAWNAEFKDRDIWKAFKGGKGLFLTMQVGQSEVSQLLREVDFNIQYLPLPKLHENEDYRSPTSAGFCGIPAIAYDKEESGLLLESMAVFGYERLKPAFFDKILSGRLSKEPADFEMLELMHSIKFYDFGFTLDEEGKLSGMMDNLVFGNSQLGGKQAVSGYLVANSTYINGLVEKANNLGKN